MTLRFVGVSMLLALTTISWAAPDEKAERSPGAGEEAKSSGPVLLVGGTHQDLPDGIRDLIFELAGGEKARIVVIPTAVKHADKPESKAEFAGPWQALKPLSVDVLHTRDRKQADDPEFVRPLTAATAVFLTNGHRDRIFSTYRSTLVEKELHKLHARGGVIAGTGTGAAVLGEWAIDRASEKRLTEPGLNLLPGILVEDRSEEDHFAAALTAHRPLLGLMIELDTAALIRGDKLRVIGDKTISLHRAKNAQAEAQSQTLKAGEELDLAKWRE